MFSPPNHLKGEGKGPGISSRMITPKRNLLEAALSFCTYLGTSGLDELLCSEQIMHVGDLEQVGCPWNNLSSCATVGECQMETLCAELKVCRRAL